MSAQVQSNTVQHRGGTTTQEAETGEMPVFSRLLSLLSVFCTTFRKAFTQISLETSLSHTHLPNALGEAGDMPQSMHREPEFDPENLLQKARLTPAKGSKERWVPRVHWSAKLIFFLKNSSLVRDHISINQSM